MKIDINRGRPIAPDKLKKELLHLLGDRLGGVGGNGQVVHVRLNGEVEEPLLQEVIQTVLDHDEDLGPFPDQLLFDDLIGDLGVDPAEWDFAGMSRAQKDKVLEWIFRRISRPLR